MHVSFTTRVSLPFAVPSPGTMSEIWGFTHMLTEMQIICVLISIVILNFREGRLSERGYGPGHPNLALSQNFGSEIPLSYHHITSSIG